MGGVEAAGGPSAGQMARHISHLLVASSALVMLLQSMRPLRIRCVQRRCCGRRRWFGGAARTAHS